MLAPTGIDDLDLLVGGVHAGDVWIIAGPARSGRTTLCVQLAAALGRAGTPVRYFLGRDSIRETAARLSAHTRSERLREARGALPASDEPWSTWALDFVPQPELLHTGEWAVLPVGGPCCLVIDDLDLWRGAPTDFLALARSHARGDGCAVIITIPLHELHVGDPETWQRWVRGADIIVSLNPRSDGLTNIELLSHRAGPFATIEAHGNFERARFETPPRTERSRPPAVSALEEK